MLLNKESSRFRMRHDLPRLLLAAAVAAFARTAAGEPSPAPAGSAAQETVTEELIRMLAAHNELSQADASKLIERLQAEKAPSATAAVPATAPTDNAAAAPAAAAAPDKGKVRVIYVPESEKQKIRDEVKAEVIAQAKAENWAQPNALPAWIKRIRFGGDFRFREEADLLDNSNDNQVFNFQTLNSGVPVNFNSAAVTVPYLNTRSDRQTPRFRARLDMTADVTDDLSVNFRLTSGNNTNPVSTNQTLGTDFNKTQLVIDRAYFDYHPAPSLQVWLGRIPNPWQSTELVFDEDLNFDGLAARYRYRWNERFSQQLTLGAFSVENTAFDFPSTTAYKGGSRDKELFAAQLGADWKLSPVVLLSGALAFYDYYHLEGKLASCGDTVFVTASTACPSDDSRPGFIQKGNTLFSLRDYNRSQNTDPLYEYFGLASPFRVLDVVLRLDTTLKGPLHLIVDADYARNLAFKKSSVLAAGPDFSKGPANNLGPCGNDPVSGVPDCTKFPSKYVGGNQAYLLQFRIGYPKIAERWQWNAVAGYRRLDSDAVVDAFTDSDFHLGGTNAKGYWVGGSLGLLHDTWLSLRYYSTSEATGSPLSIDVLQFDLTARF